MTWRQKLTMWWALFGPQHLGATALGVLAIIVLPSAVGIGRTYGIISGWGYLAMLALNVLIFWEIVDMRDRRSAAARRG